MSSDASENMSNAAEKVIRIAGSITVDELAQALGLSVTALIGELFRNGIVATINQRLDFETAEIMIEELGFANVRLERKNTNMLCRAHQSWRLWVTLTMVKPLCWIRFCIRRPLRTKLVVSPSIFRPISWSTMVG